MPFKINAKAKAKAKAKIEQMSYQRYLQELIELQQDSIRTCLLLSGCENSQAAERQKRITKINDLLTELELHLAYLANR